MVLVFKEIGEEAKRRIRDRKIKSAVCWWLDRWSTSVFDEVTRSFIPSLEAI